MKTLENQILDAVIQDHKERIVLGLTDFGDILFKEDNGQGKPLFSICQILPARGQEKVPKGEFRFQIKVVALADKSFNNILKPSSGGMFSKGASQREKELHRVLIKRYKLHSALHQRLGALHRNELYGYCDDDDYNSTNPHAQRVDVKAYLEEVLAYATENPTPFYTDIYDLKRHDTPVPFVLKEYLGYGFTLPPELFTYINLKALAIYNQSVKDLTPQKLLAFQNLNSLCLDNVDGVPQDVYDVIHDLPYLVDLSLTNTDKFRGRNNYEQIPQQLDKLNSLKYFSFAGNEVSDWSEIVKLKKLRTLNLSDCGLDHISDSIAELTHLEELNLGNNNIAVLPKALLKLEKLKIVRLNKNPLTEIPEWIAGLTKLEILEVTQCGLTSLPETITQLPNVKELQLKKNPFSSLPKSLLKLPKKTVKLEIRNQALYDPKAKSKLEQYPKGNFKFENDFNLKLMVINQLMYVDEVLLPKFNIWEFAKTYKKRNIDIEKEGYDRIPEAEAYFRELEIPMGLLIDIVELKPDGGDEIYSQIIPFWDGEDNQFDVQSVEDIKYLPNLKATNSMNFSKELMKQLRALKIKVANY